MQGARCKGGAGAETSPGTRHRGKRSENEPGKTCNGIAVALNFSISFNLESTMSMPPQHTHTHTHDGYIFKVVEWPGRVFRREGKRNGTGSGAPKF